MMSALEAPLPEFLTADPTPEAKAVKESTLHLAPILPALSVKGLAVS